MNEKSLELMKRAEFYTNELKNHQVIKNYIDKVSIILKGSTARGNADQYSDVDFVLFADESIFQDIIDDYFKAGLTTRNDGVFLPLGEWEGHYNFETFQKLQSYFDKKDLPQVWEYTNVKLLHDPKDQYKKVLEVNESKVFEAALSLVKRKYLDAQLMLDWLRHPLKRTDVVGASLHISELVRLLCQICYLIDKKPYPFDKWIFPYIETTTFGKENKQLITDYVMTTGSLTEIVPGLELNEYSQYQKGVELIEKLVIKIKEVYGDYPWIDEWYLHV